MSSIPVKIFLFSGKRKSGKDHITNLIFQRLDPKLNAMIKISGPIKSHWSSLKGLSMNDMLSSSDYKEKYREEMISWSDGIRENDYGYFCKAAIEMYNAKDKPVWIVSDIRRRTDIKWFKENYGSAIKTIRIVADDAVREKRGWLFVEGSEYVSAISHLQRWSTSVPQHNCCMLCHHRYSGNMFGTSNPQQETTDPGNYTLDSSYTNSCRPTGTGLVFVVILLVYI